MEGWLHPCTKKRNILITFATHFKRFLSLAFPKNAWSNLSVSIVTDDHSTPICLEMFLYLSNFQTYFLQSFMCPLKFRFFTFNRRFVDQLESKEMELETMWQLDFAASLSLFLLPLFLRFLPNCRKLECGRNCRRTWARRWRLCRLRGASSPVLTSPPSKPLKVSTEWPHEILSRRLYFKELSWVS